MRNKMGQGKGLSAPREQVHPLEPKLSKRGVPLRCQC